MSDSRVYVIGNKIININNVNFVKIETDKLNSHCLNFNFGPHQLSIPPWYDYEIKKCFNTEEDMHQAVKQISQHWNK